MMFNTRLRELREANNLMQKDLASKLGCSEKTISGYERGERSPKKDTLKKIANIFNVSVDYLLGDDNSDLTKREEKDIAKKLEQLIGEVNSKDGLMLYNNDLDEETKELLIASLERTLRQAKIMAKEKFTPNKYKGK